MRTERYNTFVHVGEIEIKTTPRGRFLYGEAFLGVTDDDNAYGGVLRTYCKTFRGRWHAMKEYAPERWEHWSKLTPGLLCCAIRLVKEQAKEQGLVKPRRKK